MELLKRVRAAIANDLKQKRDPGAARFADMLDYLSAPRNPFAITAGVQLLGHLCVVLLFLGNARGWFPISVPH